MSSGADEQVSLKLWEGKLPIAFAASAEDAGDAETYYMLLPRWAYLSMATSKVRAHYKTQADASGDQEPWYEFRGQPLKWNIPVGVLWDLYGGQSELPWQITVHFHGFPSQQLLSCPDLDVAEAHLLNRVKESCHIKHGNTKHEGLQDTETKKQLWLGLLQDDYKGFQRANAPLMTPSGANWYKGFPFYFHSGLDSAAASDAQAPPMWSEQEPFKVVADSGQPLTLRDLKEFMLGSDSQEKKLVIHGTEPPAETPLQWLAEHFAYPDGFVHIVCLPK